MLKPSDLEYATDQTLLAHPDFQVSLSSGFVHQILNGIRPTMYTKTNGARNLVSGMTQDDLLKYFLDEAIKIYNSASYFYYYNDAVNSLKSDQDKINRLLQTFPCFGELQKLITILSDPEVNSALYFKTNNNDLLALVNSVVEMRFSKNNSYRKYIDKNGLTESVTPNGKVVNLFDKVDKDIIDANIAKNVQVNHRAINRCLSDLMSGVQLKNQRNEYALDGTLFASQDIGVRRENQEDSVIILTHPDNPEFKFLAVADGVGGVEKGEKASSYTIQKISEWFTSLPKDAFYYPEQLQVSFNNRLMEISHDIYRTYNADFNRIIAGSTFVGAIISEDKTIVSSVGDSRAYTTDGQNLNLITRDESEVWPPSMPSSYITKEVLDDLRFNKKGNIITRCMGQPLQSIQSTIIQNQDYIRLIVMSDGVTDLLSTDRIRFLSLNSTPETLTKYLVDESLQYDAVRLRGETPEYNGRIPAGKDNTTAAAFIRR